MQGKHFVQNLGRRLEAIVLSAAMVLSVITFPAHAEENVGEADPNLVVSLVESGKEKTVDVIANPYGEGTIADEPFINEEGVGDITPVNEALGNLGEGEYLEMEVGITVKEFTSSTENAQVVIYSMVLPTGNRKYGV